MAAVHLRCRLHLGYWGHVRDDLPPPPRSHQVRRQGEIIQKIVHMIGHSVKLYDMVLQFLRTLFVKTRNVHYCTLRAELLMALHDLEIQVRASRARASPEQ